MSLLVRTVRFETKDFDSSAGTKKPILVACIANRVGFYHTSCAKLSITDTENGFIKGIIIPLTIVPTA